MQSSDASQNVSYFYSGFSGRNVVEEGRVPMTLLYTNFTHLKQREGRDAF
jgi:hypothetical protein